MSALSFTTIFSTNLSNPEQSGRRGKITWGELRTDPESLIDSRFLLEAKLNNPTRMPIKDITPYWKHWAFKGRKRDPFSFTPDNSSDRGKEDNDSDKGRDDDYCDDDDFSEKPVAPDHHGIDDDIPLPSQCKTPSSRTNCLQKLVPTTNKINKSFHGLVKMVDAFEVSSMLNIWSPLYLI